MSAVLDECPWPTDLANLGIAMVEEFDKLRTVSKRRALFMRILADLFKFIRHGIENVRMLNKHWSKQRLWRRRTEI